MLKQSYPYYLANEPQWPNSDLEVTDKYSGKMATRVALADGDAVDKAIDAAVEAADAMRRLPPYQRQQILSHCVTRFEALQDDLALALCVEAGKPIKDSRGEVTRLIDTFRIASEEAVRLEGEVLKDYTVQVIGTTEPGAIISINDVSKIWESPEDFSVWELLTPGETELTVSSTDRAGNSTTVIRSIQVVLLDHNIYLPIFSK